MAEVQLEKVTKVFEDQTIAVEEFDLHIKDSEFIVLVGPSGCGKSTTLKMIAGLEEITSGELLMNRQKMNDVPAKDRNVAMVFQNYALYPQMNVYNNMAFSLKLRKRNKAEIKKRISNAANILGIKALLHRRPDELSGGEKQRVALGRAIVREANVFLMDEPLSNLDAKLRTQMRTEIKKLHQRLKTTTIYVTHDQTEAMTMGDRLVVMKDGAIQQVGSPREVYECPENVFVGGFIGSPPMNFLKGKLEGKSFRIGKITFRVPEMKLKILNEQQYHDQEIILGIRPEDIKLKSGTEKEEILTPIEVAEMAGAETYLHSRLNNQPFVFRIESRMNIHEGAQVHVNFEIENAHFFDVQTEMRIK